MQKPTRVGTVAFKAVRSRIALVPCRREAPGTVASFRTPNSEIHLESGASDGRGDVPADSPPRVAIESAFVVVQLLRWPPRLAPDH